MKVLIATSESQGSRTSDYCFTTEGELVHFPFECDGEEIDGKCGCRRSMAGIESRRGTTTFKVVEMEISEDELLNKFADFYHNIWKMENSKAYEVASEEVNNLNYVVGFYEVGQILEKRGDDILPRYHI